MSALAPTYARYDVEFASGSGCVLVDAEGVEYLDFLAGIAVCNTGHCHPAVVAAVQEQVGPADPRLQPLLQRAERAARGPAVERSFGRRCSSATRARRPTRRRSSSCARRARGGDIVVAPRRVPRAHLRRAVGHAAGGQAGAVRAAGAGLPAVAPSRGGGAGRGRRADRGGADRARAGRVGRAPDPDELLAAVARGVRRGRRRAGVRRGPDRHGPHRHAVGLRADRRGAGRDDRSPRASAAGCRSARWSSAPRLADVFAPGDHGSTFAGGPVACAAANAALDVIDDEAFLRRRARARRAAAEGLRELPRRARRARARADGGVRGRRRRARARAPRAARAAAGHQRHRPDHAALPAAAGRRRAEQVDDALRRVAALL